jgi:hypothetical protein
MSDQLEPPRVSIVVPVAGRVGDGELATVMGEYAAGLSGLPAPFEILLGSVRHNAASCAEIAERHAAVRVYEAGAGGWGDGVRAGLAAARGEILGYANWERTSTEALVEMVGYALRNPDLVFRANRRTRDTIRQRLGSLVFNLECRALLGITTWDVNGTPKAFSRGRSKLLTLTQNDDMIDAEFALVCEQEGYAVAEIPIESSRRDGRASQPDYGAALRMYLGVIDLRRRARR